MANFILDKLEQFQEEMDEFRRNMKNTDNARIKELEKEIRDMKDVIVNFSEKVETLTKGVAIALMTDKNHKKNFNEFMEDQLNKEFNSHSNEDIIKSLELMKVGIGNMAIDHFTDGNKYKEAVDYFCKTLEKKGISKKIIKDFRKTELEKWSVKHGEKL